MASTKPSSSSSRYSSFDTRSSTSSHFSDPSSSSEFRNPTKPHSSLKRLMGMSNTRRKSPDLVTPVENSSRVLARAKSDVVLMKKEQNLGSMVKKFMDTRSKTKGMENRLVIPVDFIAEDLKKNGVKGIKGGKGSSNFTALHRKFFQKGSKTSEVKALTEVKSNTRTLAMVLKSERELLNYNKERGMEMTELKLMLEEKNREVEKLKDLCLKQREEIKALKSAILFPDVMSTQLQGLLESQGSELKQAKQIIPTLQRQVISLTDQLQCIAVDLAEVKADKYGGSLSFEGHVSSPRTPIFGDEATNSLDFSSEDPRSPGSPDDLFLKDLNPCLTPYSAKSKSKEFDDIMGYDPVYEKGSYGSSRNVSHDYHPQGGKMSRSSEYCQKPNLSNSALRAGRWSDENKCTNGKPMHHKHY